MERILQNKEPTHRNPDRTLVAASAIKVAIGLVLIVLLLATIGKLYEEWATVLWLVSLGGQFWGAVSVGLISVACATWAGLIISGMEKIEASTAEGTPKRKAAFLFWLSATQITGLVIFLVSNFALYVSYDAFSGLDIYQKIAVVVMRGSSIVGIHILVLNAAFGYRGD